MQFVNIQFTGDKALYPAFGELMAHERADILSDGIGMKAGSAFMQLTELPDDEGAEVMKMAVNLAKHVKAELGKYKPGDTASSTRPIDRSQLVRPFVCEAEEPAELVERPLSGPSQLESWRPRWLSNETGTYYGESRRSAGFRLFIRMMIVKAQSPGKDSIL